MASEKSAQPHTIEALDEQGLQAIQQNFEILFRDITGGFSLTSDDITGVLAVTRGGTGLTSVAIGDLLYGSAVNTLSTLTIGAAGKVIRSNGTLPVYSTFTIADTFVSGTVVRASAANTLAASNWTIQASFGTGGMIYASSTNTLVQLDIGTAGKVIRSNGTIPAYSTFTIVDTFASGSIPHASSSNALTALTVGAAGKIIRSTGTLPAYTTFTIADTFAQGSIPMASTADTLTALAVGAAGTILVGGATVPSYSATPTITTSVTVPLVIGGTGAASTLILKSTSGVGTTDAIIFQVGNNGAIEAGRFTTTGLLSLPIGQIQFPAAQNASSGTNTLDDYEEGTWTPTLTFATPGDLSVVYSVRIGNYQKVGKWVHCMFEISVSTWTHTTAAGNFQITGLPFASKTEANAVHIGAMNLSGVNFSAGYTFACAYLQNNVSLLLVVETGDNVGQQALTTAGFPTAVVFGLSGHIHYETAG